MALQPPLSSGPAGPAGAAMDEHLLLLRIATASEVLLDIRMFGFVSTSPSLAGWSGREGEGKRDLRCCFYHPPWQLLGWRLCWKDGYCCWLWLDLLAISRMLCSVAVSGVMLHTVPDLEGKKKARRGKKWPYTLSISPGQLAAGPAGVTQEEHLLLLGNKTTA